MSSFDPNSTDAVFARIIESLDTLKTNQDVMRTEMKTGFENIGTRVVVLEKEKWYQRGIVAAISSVVMFAGWLITNHPSSSVSK